MDRIAELKTIVDQPYTYLQNIKEQKGKKIIGTVCSYAPEEVICAAGALPVRLFGSSAALSLADRHLQAYSCSLVRGILEEALAGRLDVLDGMVFPHTCDTIQRLSDVWRINLPSIFHADVVLPVKLNTQSARIYLHDVLSQFVRELQKKLGKEISGADLARAVKLYNAVRSRLRRLQDLRCAYPHILSGSDYHTIVRAAMLLERETFLEAIEQIVADLEKTVSSQQPTDARRLVLSGSVCSAPDIYDAIENAGGVVVGDDLCTGARYFAGDLSEEMEPLAAMTERWSERTICPAKHKGLTDRGRDLVRLVRDVRADGVIFLLLKFCDPHAFDYPYLKEMLDQEGIGSLLLEVEEQTQAGGQLATRVETFVQIV